MASRSPLSASLAPAACRRNVRWPLAISCGLFVALAAQFMWVTPPLETPDAVAHYQYIHTLVQQHQFPTLPSTDPLYSAKQEAGQFPLYYLAGAALVAPIGDANLDDILVPDPHRLAETGAIRNYSFHKPPGGFPTGAELAIRLVELFSIACGAVTVACTVLLARMYRPEKPGLWLAAGTAAAVLPAFDSLSAGVTNDNLVIALSAVTLVLLAEWLQDGRARWACLAMLSLALAVLTKFNAAGLVAPFLLVCMYREKTWLSRLARLGQLAAVGLLVDGWWMVRNLRLYGDPTGMLAVNREMSGPGYAPFHVPAAQVLGHMAGQLPRIFREFFVTFDHFPSESPQALAWFVTIGGLGLIVGLCMSLRKRWWGQAQLMLLWIGIVALEAVAYVVLSDTYGRFLYLALPPIAVLAVDGWARILSGLRRPVLGYGLVAVSAAVTSACAWLVVGPAFAYPPALEALPASARPLHATFAGSVELLGAELTPDRTLTLYWRRTGPLSLPLSEFIHVDSSDPAYKPGFDYEGATGGNFPPNFWPAGAVIADKHPLTLAPDQRLDRRDAVLLTVRTGMYDLSGHAGASMQRVAADPPGAADTGVEVGQVKLPGQPPAAPAQSLAEFGNGLALLDARATPDGFVHLRWQARAAPSANATVFVQAIDGDGRVLAQHDSFPLDGRYPTSLWSTGEQVFDRVPLKLPRSLGADDRIIVGMYVLPDATQRIPTVDGRDSVIVPG